jgi:hypothetical protein
VRSTWLDESIRRHVDLPAVAAAAAVYAAEQRLAATDPAAFVQAVTARRPPIPPTP